MTMTAFPLIDTETIRPFFWTDDDLDDLVQAHAFQRGLNWCREFEFRLTEWDLDMLEELALTVHAFHRIDARKSIAMVENSSGEIGLLIAERGRVSLKIWGTSYANSTDLAERIRDGLIDRPDADGLIPVSFWFSEDRWPTSRVRQLDRKPWSSIAENYPSRSKLSLDKLVKETTASLHGIGIWQGPAGTGKTHAVRMLATEWMSWCDVHVLDDPHTLLGDGADRMLETVLDLDGARGDRFVDGRPSGDARLRLLVLEDAGELVSLDAASQSGRSLARLLNLTDGLAGEGLPVAVLITTNEELGRLHPAITRPGRCWSKIPFEQFTRQDGSAWLTNQPSSATSDAGGERTLAELYALSRGEELLTSGTSIGFGATS